MYSDGKLGAVEGPLVRGVLDTFQFESELRPQPVSGRFIARVREEAQTADSARAYAVSLAQNFASPEHKRAVYKALDRVVASDNELSARENALLSLVNEVFKM